MIYDTFAALPIWVVAGLALAGIWTLTGRVDSTRLWGAVKETDGFFEYKAQGYRFRFPWPFPVIWLKLAIGKIG